MRKFLPIMAILFSISIFYGCDKEKIVTSTEVVKETEYLELPPDTVMIADTIFMSDSIVINNTDTVYSVSTDTVVVNTVVYSTDTVYQTETIVDTITNTETIIDTVTITETVIDTVTQIKNSPDAYYAYSALQYQTNPGVLQFINTEFGFSDGWIFYLTSFQNDITNPSEGVFEFYGYIDYWTPDWSSYYPLEYLWRVTYTGGDPSDPNNWSLTDPPTAVNGNSGGIKLKIERENLK